MTLDRHYRYILHKILNLSFFICLILVIVSFKKNKNQIRVVKINGTALLLNDSTKYESILSNTSMNIEFQHRWEKRKVHINPSGLNVITDSNGNFSFKIYTNLDSVTLIFYGISTGESPTRRYKGFMTNINLPYERKLLVHLQLDTIYDSRKVIESTNPPHTNQTEIIQLLDSIVIRHKEKHSKKNCP